MTRPTGPEPLVSRLAENRARLQAQMGNLADVVWRDLLLPTGGGRPRPALLVYLEAAVDGVRLEESILRPLFAHGADVAVSAEAGRSRLPVGRVQGAETVAQAVRAILRGEVALLVDGHPGALLLDVKNPPHRPVERPQVEVSVHGGEESFTELLEVNMGLIRRRLPTPYLRMERREIGGLSRTAVVMAYVEGKAPRGLVRNIRRRLDKLNPELVLDAEGLIDALADRPYSIFPTVHVTQRPDLVCSFLAAGRVLVLADNSPRALLVPGLLIDLLGAVDDFYERRPFAVLIRVLRMLAFLVSIFLPATYVAVLTYHVQALPTLLTLSLLAQREGAPLPTTVEAFIMVVTFEILREAGLRLPRAVGPSVSIVGGLVIGEAAMRAGLATPAMVLVVSATAVSTFAIPSTSLANVATPLRLALLMLASTFGFFGLLVGYVVLGAHVAGLTSGRVPYATPYMPLQPGHLPDAYAAHARTPHGPGPTSDPTLAEPPGRQDRKQRRRR